MSSSCRFGDGWTDRDSDAAELRERMELDRLTARDPCLDADLDAEPEPEIGGALVATGVLLTDPPGTDCTDSLASLVVSLHGKINGFSRG